MGLGVLAYTISLMLILI